MYNLSRISSFLFKVLLVILVAAFVVARGPWTAGTWSAQTQVNANPKFADRLNRYSQTGQELAFVFAWAEVARPIVDAVNFAKNIQVWDTLLEFADRFRPGLKIAVNILAEFAETVTQLQQEFSELGRLSAAARAVRVFQTSPGEMTLRPLAKQADDGAKALDAIHEELLKIDPLVISVNSSIYDIIDFLRDSANLPLVGEIARGLIEPVTNLANKITPYINQFRNTEEQISQDAALLHSLALTSNGATSIDQWLRSTFLFGPALAVTTNAEVLTKLLIALAVAWLIFWLADKLLPRRAFVSDSSHGSEQRVRVVIETPPAQPASVQRTISEPAQQAPLLPAALVAAPLQPQAIVPPAVQSSQSTPASPQSRQTHRLRGSIAVQRAGNVSESYPLPPAGQFVIGSGELVDLRLTDPFVCERHAVIRPARTSYFVETADDNATVFVNGQAIEKSRKLDDGDIIRVGSTMFIISLQGTHS